MIEQKKMDAERVAFEAWWNDDSRLTMRTFTAKHWAEAIWQARASLPVGVPEGYRWHLVPKEDTHAFNAACSAANDAHLGGVGPCGVFIAGYRAMLAAAPTVKAEQADREAFRAHLSECAAEVEKWPEWKQAALGSQTPRKSPYLRDEVERMVRALEDGEWAEHAGQTELGARLESAITTLINRLQAPSLPAAGSAAGSAVEEVEVVAHLFIKPDGKLSMDAVRHKPSQPAEAVMTVAQHNRIVAALSAQQAGAVSVPDTARLDFMLSNWRKVVCERLRHDNFEVYVEEGFMGDKRYPSVRYSGEWEQGSPEGLEIQREAIDAAMLNGGGA